MPDRLDDAQRDLIARAERLAHRLEAIDEDLPAAARRHAAVDAAKDLGLYGMSQPRAFGGSEAGQLDLVVARETLAGALAPLRRHVFGPGPGFLAGVEGRLAEDYLAPMLAGTKRSAFAFTDPAEGPATVTRRDGDGWRIDGCKSYVTGGAEADFFGVVARLEAPETGAVFLLVDAGAAGLTRSEPFSSMDGSHHVRLDFEGVKVPGDALVGAPGEGMPRALRQIGDVRLALAAEACGLMQWTLAHLEQHLRQPHRGGGTLGDREGVRLRFADARIHAFAARSMLYRTARLADAGENVVNEGIACKVFATEKLGEIVDTAMQLEGGRALVTGHPLERLYREVRVLRLAEGASDVLRLNLARGRLELGKGRL